MSMYRCSLCALPCLPKDLRDLDDDVEGIAGVADEWRREWETLQVGKGIVTELLDE